MVLVCFDGERGSWTTLTLGRRVYRLVPSLHNSYYLPPGLRATPIAGVLARPMWFPCSFLVQDD